jgi:hypothetical protein
MLYSIRPFCRMVARFYGVLPTVNVVYKIVQCYVCASNTVLVFPENPDFGLAIGKACQTNGQISYDIEKFSADYFYKIVVEELEDCHFNSRMPLS